MKSIGEIEEHLAEKSEAIIGIKPSSKFKRGPIGIFIYVVWGIIAFFSQEVRACFSRIHKDNLSIVCESWSPDLQQSSGRELIS